MPKIELRSYSKARTPLGTLLRLFRYFRHCRLILISAVVSILLYCAATIAASGAVAGRAGSVAARTRGHCGARLSLLPPPA